MLMTHRNVCPSIDHSLIFRLCVVVALTMQIVANIHASDETMIIAHREASYHSPENTVVAYKAAWAFDSDGAETDAHLTKDNQLVCIHDSTTKRTVGVDWVVARTNL